MITLLFIIAPNIILYQGFPIYKIKKLFYLFKIKFFQLIKILQYFIKKFDDKTFFFF